MSENERTMSGKRLGWGLRRISTQWNVLAGAIVVPLVAYTVRLTPQEFHDLLVALIPFIIVAMSATFYLREKEINALADFVERHQAGTASPEDYRLFFHRVMNLPRKEVLLSAFCWVTIPVPVVVAAWILSPTMSPYTAFVIGLAAMCAGAYSLTFVFYSFKRFLAPLRLITSNGVPDPLEREGMIRSVPLGLKLTLIASSLIVGSTFFAVSIGQSRLYRTFEDMTAKAQQAQLASVTPEALRLRETPELFRPRPLAIQLGTSEFLLLDGESGEVVAGRSDLLRPTEIELVLADGADQGDSSGFASDMNFAWRRLDDGRHVLVTASPGSIVEGSFAQEQGYILFAAAIAATFGIFAMRVVTGDLGRSFGQLQSRLERVADGNLRSGEIFESEDDLGMLARRIDVMTQALRDIVVGVVSAGDRVEQAATAIAEQTTEVQQSSDVQGSKIREVTGSMERIREHVAGIRDSAAVLDESVEESYSSVRELTTAGDGLEHSGTELEEQVHGAARAFAGVHETIDLVVSTAEQLAQAADGTNASLEEMAASLRQIDVHAAQTASHSEDVISSAEEGQHKVQETIDGMATIQQDRAFIVGVVRDLSARTDEIGKIVEVITSVADETNLLALNAAIISAQAGEHGRSFAVVADEIKQLASRVLESTKEITAVVQAVQQGAEAAVEATDRGESAMVRGVALSNEAGAMLAAITDSARQSGVRMNEVVTAVREQSGAAGRAVELMMEVGNGVERIKEASRQQGERTAEVSRANEAMSTAAGRVKEATFTQGRSSGRIASGIERVNTVASEIVKALAEQSAAVDTVGRLLASVNERTLANQESNQKMDDAAQELLDQATTLRDGVRRFEI